MACPSCQTIILVPTQTKNRFWLKVVCGILVILAAWFLLWVSFREKPVAVPPQFGLRGGLLGDIETGPFSSEFQGRSLDESDYREFGKKLQENLSSRDRNALYDFFRMGALFAKTVSGLDPSPKEWVELASGYRRGKKGFVDLLADVVQNGAKYGILRTRMLQGKPSLIMRLLHPEEGATYHEYHLTRNGEGKIFIEDVYVYMTGEFMAQSIRRFFLQALGENNLFTFLTLGEKSITQNIPKIKALHIALAQARFQEALDTYYQLPEVLQNDHILMIQALQASRRVNEEKQIHLLEKFSGLYPENPATDMLSINFFFLRKDYQQAIACIDKVYRLVGDPWLLVLKGNALYESGDVASGKKMMEKAIEQEPSLGMAYLARVEFSLRENNHSDTMTWLKKR